jgi:hypothetical protein
LGLLFIPLIFAEIMVASVASESSWGLSFHIDVAGENLGLPARHTLDFGIPGLALALAPRFHYPSKIIKIPDLNTDAQ